MANDGTYEAAIVKCEAFIRSHLPDIESEATRSTKLLFIIELEDELPRDFSHGSSNTSAPLARSWRMTTLPTP